MVEFYNSGSGRKGVKPGKKPNEIKPAGLDHGPEQKEKRFDTPSKVLDQKEKLKGGAKTTRNF